MVRNYIKKTKQGSVPGDVIRRAISCVSTSGRSVRSVAEEFGFNHVSLGRYVKKSQGSAEPEKLSFGIGRFRQVFSTEQEKILGQFLTEAAYIYFGLSPKEVRESAYNYAVVHNINVPDSWHIDKQAGEDWFSNFMKRNPDLSIRTPEPTSLSRATSFNQINVQMFFEKLANVVDRDDIEPENIWNCHETGITTVQRPRNIVAPKGVKQIGQLTSAERGAHITMCAAVNATGNSMPPMCIFPRVKYHDHFVRDGPTGCIGAALPSGWMTAQNFLKFMHHFIKHAKPTPENKVLLLLDNHISHISVECLDIAKEHGVVMLSFPPHCSHKLQPLDRSVYGPFKKHINTTQDAWMRNNPGHSMTIYDIPSQIRDAWPLAATPNNIKSGFRVSGIFPHSINVFSEKEFAPCSVIDRPAPASTQSNGTGVHANLDDIILNLGREVVSISGDGHCLLHAFRFALLHEGIANASHDEICESLTNEIREKNDYYDDFAAEGQSLDQDIERYINEKEYNTDTADLIINALCNVYGVSAIIYRNTSSEDNNVQINAIAPSRPGVLFRGDIHLILTGNRANAHYNATRKISDQLFGHSQPAPETSQFSATRFSPKLIQPHPKAAPRKANIKSKPRRKSAILTYTPEKKLIEEEVAKKMKKQPKLTVKNGKENKKPAKRTCKVYQSTRLDDSSSDDDQQECYCLICVEPWSNSRPGEDWIQCYVCKGWAHDECSGVSKTQVFVCQNCDSDDDVFL